MTRAAAPVDLLRELRAGFLTEAQHYRQCQQNTLADDEGGKRAFGAKAYAAESAVRKIDATLRDWA